MSQNKPPWLLVGPISSRLHLTTGGGSGGDVAVVCCTAMALRHGARALLSTISLCLLPRLLLLLCLYSCSHTMYSAAHAHAQYTTKLYSAGTRLSFRPAALCFFPFLLPFTFI